MTQTVYWVIVPSSDTEFSNNATDAAKIKSGQRQDGSAASWSGSEVDPETSGSVNIDEQTPATGLTSGTQYRIAATIWDGTSYGGGSSPTIYVVESDAFTTFTAAVAASAGSSTAQAVGAAVSTAVAASAGSSTAQATGKATSVAVAASAGNSTAQAVGSSLLAGTAVAASAGSSTAQAVGKAAAAAVASSAGSSTAQAVGAAVSAAVAASAGSSTAQVIGKAVSAAVAASAGSSTAQAVGSTVLSSSGAASAVGTSTAQAVGASRHAAVAFAAGISAADGRAYEEPVAPPVSPAGGGDYPGNRSRTYVVTGQAPPPLGPAEVVALQEADEEILAIIMAAVAAGALEEA